MQLFARGRPLALDRAQPLLDPGKRRPCRIEPSLEGEKLELRRLLRGGELSALSPKGGRIVGEARRGDDEESESGDDETEGGSGLPANEHDALNVSECRSRHEEMCLFCSIFV